MEERNGHRTKLRRMFTMYRCQLTSKDSAQPSMICLPSWILISRRFHKTLDSRKIWNLIISRDPSWSRQLRREMIIVIQVLGVSPQTPRSPNKEPRKGEKKGGKVELVADCTF